MSPFRRLEALLGAHAPVDDEEARHLETIRAFVARTPDPFDRRVAEGHLTGSAFVLDPVGRVLLTHHARLGIWVQLGGHADGERDAAAVARREAHEESGLEDLVFHPALVDEDGLPRLLDVDVHPIPARRDEPAHLHHDLRFAMLTGSPELIRHDPNESHALAWLTLDEAGARGDPGLRRALARLARLVE